MQNKWKATFHEWKHIILTSTKLSCETIVELSVKNRKYLVNQIVFIKNRSCHNKK
jgi:hypothetical protein